MEGCNNIQVQHDCPQEKKENFFLKRKKCNILFNKFENFQIICYRLTYIDFFAHSLNPLS